MGTAVSMAWDAAGRPEHPKSVDVSGTCLVCGVDAARTLRAADGIGKNFDLINASRPDSTRVCVPCAWALAGKPPKTFRMWSVVVTEAHMLAPSLPGVPYPSDGHLHLCNRRDMSQITRILARPPGGAWAVCVAQSGQKHILPYTPVNHGDTAWTVRFEATNVTSTPGAFSTLLGAVASLRVAGHHTQTIVACAPNITALKGPGLEAWRTWEPVIRPYRESPLIELAAFLTTKENIHGIAETYAPRTGR